MPKKFAVMTSKGIFYITKVVREKVKLAIPMLTAAFIVMGAGFTISESELVALAASPNINVTVNAGNANDGKMYSDNWRLNGSNNWEYYDNGNKVTNAWIQDHNHWYLVDESGTMRVGLYKSYDKYYLLDDIRGTGTYGKLLKNGSTYQGVTISADTSSDYEGALSEDTLNRLASVGVKRDNAVNVTGTAHNTNNGTAQTQGSGNVWDVNQYKGDGTTPVRIVSNREGGNILTGIYEDGRYYCIGNDGKKYKRHPFSTTARYFPNAEDFLASDWAKYLDTGKVAPDGGKYYRSNTDGKRVIYWQSTLYDDMIGASTVSMYYKADGVFVSDKYKDY